jgi:hypothetical protein
MWVTEQTAQSFRVIVSGEAPRRLAKRIIT